MVTQHRIEVFTEGCASCDGAVAYGHELASSSPTYEVRVWDVTGAEGSARMQELGIADLPALAIDGEPLACCAQSKEEAGE